MEYSKILQDNMEYSRSLLFHFILEYSRMLQNILKYSKIFKNTQKYLRMFGNILEFSGIIGKLFPSGIVYHPSIDFHQNMHLNLNIYHITLINTLNLFVLYSVHTQK